MSQWRMTRYDAFLGREITTVTLMPDVDDRERTPFEAYLLIADKTREAEWFALRTAAEVRICKRQNRAAVCVPGWVLQTGDPVCYLTQHVPVLYSGLFPLKLTFLHGEGSAAKWMEANAGALSTCFTLSPINP